MNVAYFYFRILDFGFCDLFSIENRKSKIQIYFLLLSRTIIFVSAFVTARLVSACRLSPRGYRVTSARSFTFTAAVRVIDRVHRYTANFRAPAHPAAASRFTQADVLVLGVSDLSDRRHADDRNLSDFARGHSQLCIIAFFSNDLCKAAGRTDHLAAFSGTKLDIVNLRSERDILDRQRISRQDIRVFAAQDHRVDLQTRAGR